MRDTLLRRVQETIDRHRMLAPGETIVLGVSGGVDSMVLLHLLLHLRSRYHSALHIAHLNHDLRGHESAEAADFVRCQCEIHQIPATISTADGQALRGRGSGSLQAVARDLRYRFLEQVADEQGAGRIALGHHRDDQAETMLMNLLRGSGSRGLGGIPPVRGRVIRPLIDCSREEIEQYARHERIPYVEDSSNRSLAYHRNRIRLRLLPELAKQYNPRVIHLLANAATVLEAEDRLLNELTEREFHAALISRSRAALSLSVSRMTTLPDALRWRMIRRSAEELRGEGRAGLTFRQTLAIDRLLTADRARGAVHAGEGMRARRVGDRIVLSIGGHPTGNRIAACRLVVPGLTIVPGSSVNLQSDLLDEWTMDRLVPDCWSAYLDADRTGTELYVRGWEQGDRFVPLGMTGRKKLQDFFVDAKVPRDRRERVAVVVSGGRIVWVVGYRVDERFKVTDATRWILRVRAAATREVEDAQAI